jgi:regulator of cell morphogenesis and NO signaling
MPIQIAAQAAPATDGEEPRWSELPAAALIKHILDQHHAFTRAQLDKIDALSREALRVHGTQHPELGAIRELFEAIEAELRPHLSKEEVILFPYIEELDVARRAGRARPFAPFGSAENPIRVMMHDHDHVDDLFRQMRVLTGDYGAPPDAGESWVALYAALRELRDDLEEHIHLESDVLFPRALELER